MQKNTNTRHRWRQALLSAVLGALAQIGGSILLLWLRHTLASSGVLSAILLILALVNLFTLIPLAFSLRQRYYEILGGEEDAASQY